MKRRLFILTTLILVTCAAHAQRDIKTLEGKTSSQITKLTGTPSSTDLGKTFSYLDIYEYKDTKFAIDRDSKTIDSFETTSNKYCILSDLISGGIKVGDCLSKLQGFDFARSKYGRNKSSNALKNVNTSEFRYPIFGNMANYVVNESEYETIFFSVKNGKITAWAYITKEDSPYSPYDSSNTLW